MRRPSSPVDPRPGSASVDAVQRFVFENEPVRGHFVRLHAAWRALREHRDYPAPVRTLLGEAASASVLLAATLKFHGTLTLQLTGDGAVRLLVAQCTHDFRLRALARVDEERIAQLPSAPDGPFRHLVGDRARFAATIEAAERDVRYQGIVPLEGGSLSASLEAYFAASEQLPTRVQLAADGTQAAGLLVQRLPASSAAQGGEGAETAWRDAERGVRHVEHSELLSQPLERVLVRHFGGRDVRLYAGSAVRFECRCGPARVAQVLRALGAGEVRDVLAEQGSVTVTCDFCSRPYRFDAIDVERILAPGAVPEAPRSVQ